MPLVLFAAALGSAAVLRYLAERGRQADAADAQPAVEMPPPERAEADATLRRDPRTGEWRL